MGSVPIARGTCSRVTVAPGQHFFSCPQCAEIFGIAAECRRLAQAVQYSLGQRNVLDGAFQLASNRDNVEEAPHALSSDELLAQVVRDVATKHMDEMAASNAAASTHHVQGATVVAALDHLCKVTGAATKKIFQRDPIPAELMK